MIKFELPVENVTNCVFGGSDLKTLFITTANNSGKNKYDGSLFALNVNVLVLKIINLKFDFLL